jgi:hypothetical protein
LNQTTTCPNFLINQKIWEIVKFSSHSNEELGCVFVIWFDSMNTSSTIFQNNDRLRTIQWNSKQMNNIWMWR